MEKTIKKTCNYCKEVFDCLLKEHKRGNGQFCSLSCTAKYNNLTKTPITNICKLCGEKFSTTAKNAKYCSKSCKSKYYSRTSRGKNSAKTKKLLDSLRSLPCEICGWDEASRDVHHIVGISNGGQTKKENLITLCPNHHRMAHSNLISKDSLIKAAKSRTISSSSNKEELDALAGN